MRSPHPPLRQPGRAVLGEHGERPGRGEDQPQAVREGSAPSLRTRDSGSLSPRSRMNRKQLFSKNLIHRPPPPPACRARVFPYSHRHRAAAD